MRQARLTPVFSSRSIPITENPAGARPITFIQNDHGNGKRLWLLCGHQVSKRQNWRVASPIMEAREMTFCGFRVFKEG
jgi:hypothetical protein